MRYKQPKTQGLERLWLCMVSFNGFGYADKTDAESFATSFIKYKQWSGKKEDAELAINNWQEALDFGEKLCRARDGQKPNQKNYQKFLRFCENPESNKVIDNIDTLPLL